MGDLFSIFVGKIWQFEQEAALSPLQAYFTNVNLHKVWLTIVVNRDVGQRLSKSKPLDNAYNSTLYLSMSLLNL